MLPLAELHCHIEGAAPPAMVRELAHRNGQDIAGLIDGKGRYVYSDFDSFLDAYDRAASVFTTPEDYRNLAYAYSESIAKEGAIYSELFASTDHARLTGVDSFAYLKAIADGQKDAERDFGIVGRIIPTGVRHMGADHARVAAEIAVEAAKTNSHITGFGLAGSEVAGTIRDFAPAFAIAEKAGLGLTCHAGEWTGPKTIRDALDLGVTRIGHGISAAQDKSLMAELAAKGIVLEVCPMSNVVLGASGPMAEHPAKALHQAGIKITANSDDPPFFGTTLLKDYEAMAEILGEPAETLFPVLTRTALEAAFVDAPTRAMLMEKLSMA